MLSTEKENQSTHEHGKGKTGRLADNVRNNLLKTGLSSIVFPGPVAVYIVLIK